MTTKDKPYYIVSMKDRYFILNDVVKRQQRLRMLNGRAWPDLGHKTINRLNSQSAFYQPALKVFQTEYKARGVIYDRVLDLKTYILGDAIAAIGRSSELAKSQRLKEAHNGNK